MKSNPDDYIPISIEDLDFSTPVDMNLYLKIGEDKFVLVSKKGSAHYKDEIKKYMSRDVKYLWVPKKEHLELVNAPTNIAGVPIDVKSEGSRATVQLIEKKTGEIFRGIGQGGFKKESFEAAMEVTQVVLTLMTHNKSFSDVLDSLAEYEDSIVKHSIAVSSISLLIAQEMGWSGKLTLEKLALSGLLHEIGLKAIPKDIIEKPLFLLSESELETYKTHCYKGMEMLSRLGMVPDDVITAVYQHHERPDGEGYPQGLEEKAIHPYANILAIADDFIEMTLPNPNNPNGKQPWEALEHLESVVGRPYNKDCYEALLRIIDKKYSAAS